MATETAAATAAAAVAAENASGGIGAVSAAAAGVKAFVLSNPVMLAGVGGLVVGFVGYHFLFDHGESMEGDHEHQDGEVDAKAAEPSAA
jgi:hypothetical protein